MAEGFYVTLRRANRARLLLGPYTTQQEAEQNVERGSMLACEYDKWCWFDEFGTCKVEQDTLPKSVFETPLKPRRD